MADRRKKKRHSSRRRRKEDDYPGWVWMLFGLAIGLSVAFAVYVKDSSPPARVAAQNTEPASLQNALDNNGEAAALEAVAEEPAEDRFDFYRMLPAFEMIIDDEAPAKSEDVKPAAIEEPGLYLLQAGSFSTNTDANRRKAELALHGIESRVQRASVNSRDYYRVYIGPISNLDELNITRSRLRAAQIDVMRIRLGD